jgi:hypothetical protein
VNYVGSCFKLEIGEAPIAPSQCDDDCDIGKVLFSFWSEVDVVGMTSALFLVGLRACVR